MSTNAPKSTRAYVCKVQCRLAPLVRSHSTPWPATGPRAEARLPSPAPAVVEAATAAVAAAVAHPRLRLPARRWMGLGAVGLGVASLVGCAALFDSSKPLEVTPVMRLDAGTREAEQAYQNGKQALGLGIPHAALLQFDRAAALRPGWADATNGRVVAMARTGRAAEAAAVAREAIAQGVTSAELQANLALLQQRLAADAGQATATAPATALPTSAAAPTAAAAAAPTAAAVLAPLRNVLSWLMHAPNVMELQSDETLRAERAAAAVVAQTALTPPAAPAPATAATAATAGPPATSTPEVAKAPPAVAAAVAPRQQAATATATATALPALAGGQRPAAVLTAVALHPAMRLEVSNGAGRPGLARDAARALQTAGAGPARLSNHANFRVERSEIQFRGVAQAPAAQALARSMAIPVTLVDTGRLRDGVDLKVLLGGDAQRQVARALPLVHAQPAPMRAQPALVALLDRP